MPNHTAHSAFSFSFVVAENEIGSAILQTIRHWDLRNSEKNIWPQDDRMMDDFENFAHSPQSFSRVSERLFSMGSETIDFTEKSHPLLSPASS